MYLLLLISFILNVPSPVPVKDYCVELIKQIDSEDYESVEDVIISRDGVVGFELHLLLSRKSLFMNFKVNGGGKCIDDNEQMTVIFTDGSGLTMINDNNFNCDGVYTQHFGENFGKKKELKKFLNHTIHSIEITTDGDPVAITLNADESVTILDTLICLTNKM